jgi:hypothetical protein
MKTTLTTIFSVLMFSFIVYADQVDDSDTQNLTGTQLVFPEGIWQTLARI